MIIFNKEFDVEISISEITYPVNCAEFLLYENSAQIRYNIKHEDALKIFQHNRECKKCSKFFTFTITEHNNFYAMFVKNYKLIVKKITSLDETQTFMENLDPNKHGYSFKISFKDINNDELKFFHESNEQYNILTDKFIEIPKHVRDTLKQFCVQNTATDKGYDETEIMI